MPTLNSERRSEHDLQVAESLARVLTGGNMSPLDTTPETAILDLEREAVVSLFRTPQTQQTMAKVIGE